MSGRSRRTRSPAPMFHVNMHSGNSSQRYTSELVDDSYKMPINFRPPHPQYNGRPMSHRMSPDMQHPYPPYYGDNHSYAHQVHHHHHQVPHQPHVLPPQHSSPPDINYRTARDRRLPPPQPIYRDHYIPSNPASYYNRTHASPPFPPSHLQQTHPQHSLPTQNSSSHPTYKILCITNLNSKVNDGVMKDALIREFSRYGDISVSICHDNGERLAYIYFRFYEEAREARYSHSRTIMFDKPIEIEPIYEQRQTSNNPDSNAPTYPRRRSVTPPEYYNHETLRYDPALARSSRAPYINQSVHHRTPASPQPSNYSSRTSPYQPPPTMQHYRHGQYITSNDVHQSHLPAASNNYVASHYEYQKSGYYPNSNPQYSPNHPLANRLTSRSDTEYSDNMPRRSSYIDQYRGKRVSEDKSTSPRGGPPSSHSSYHHSITPNDSTPTRYSPTNVQNSHSSRQSLGSSSKDRDIERGIKSNGRYINDGRPTKTIFISNIDPLFSDSDLRNIFKQFGVIEDMELRRATSAINTSNAFVRFTTTEMAQRAKLEMDNRLIGKYQCKISYGTTNPNKKLWIGGLGPWVDSANLEDEFVKFGPIVSIDFNTRLNYAYVEFENSDIATTALRAMTGFAFYDKTIKIDFADCDDYDGGSTEKFVDGKIESKSQEYGDRGQKRSASPSDEFSTDKPSKIMTVEDSSSTMKKSEDNDTTSKSPQDQEQVYLSNGKNDCSNEGLECKPKAITAMESTESGQDIAISIDEVIKSCPVSWEGLFILKTCGFMSKMYLCNNDIDTVERFITKLDTHEKKPVVQLRLTQRLLLQSLKFKDLIKRMQGENNCMFLIVESHKPYELVGNSNGSSHSKEQDITFTRPLKSLVAYFKRKDAAGALCLSPLDGSQDVSNADAKKLLYVFPPCSFSTDLLLQAKPNLTSYTFKEDYLLGIVARKL